MSQQFGGSWTDKKMKIVVEYAKAYLTIMNKISWVKTIYFDGFAGSGLISGGTEEDMKKGTALQIMDITSPKPFNMYYFVELDGTHKSSLEKQIEENYKDRTAYVVQDDCNIRLKSLAEFLKNNKTHRALAFVDPYGMDVAWSSIEALKSVGIDLWILVPSGVGTNRLLMNNGEIPDGWYTAIENHLGITREEIDRRFYRKSTVPTLFGNVLKVTKEKDVVQKLGDLYAERLKEIFKYVSQPFVLKNSTNSIMYHFMMATNNAAGVKIADDVIKPKYDL